jgi:hypothetical protein
MEEVSVSISAEQYERLAAIAAARGVSAEAQLDRLIEDAYRGAEPADLGAEELPLGVCNGDDGDGADD